MSLASGKQAYILVAPETTYGVAATTGFVKLDIVSMNLDPVIGMIPDPSLYNQRGRRGLYQAGLVYKGTIRVRGNYEGMAPLFRAAMLGYAFAQASAGPPVANNHTFTDGLTLRSLTAQMQEGGVAGTVQQALGMVVTGFTIRTTPGQSADAMLTVDFTVIAKDKVSGVTENGSPTSPAVNPILYHQGITVVDGSGDSGIIVTGYELTYNAPYADDRYYVGSLNPAQPVPNDFVQCRIRLTREFDSLSLFTKAKTFADPAAAIDFLFQGGTIVAAHKFELETKISSAKLVEYGNPITDYGIVKANSTWEAYYNATDLSTLVLRLKNSDAQLT